MKRSEIIHKLKEIIYVLEQGCGDNSCQNPNKKPGGQGTNASCRCHPREIQDMIECVWFDMAELPKYARWEKEDEPFKAISFNPGKSDDDPIQPAFGY